MRTIEKDPEETCPNTREVMPPVTEQGIESIFSEVEGKIFNTVYCMLGDYQDTEDVVQEIFLRAYRGRSSFQGRSSFTTWLYRITMNTVGGHIKKKGRYRSVHEGRSVEELEVLGQISSRKKSVEKAFDQREIDRAIQKSLMTLNPDFRAVFILKNIEGYSYREIAEMMDISIGTVESRLFRAREQLRKELSNFSLDGSDQDE